MKLQAVIFDWAGTLVDHGSRAPVAALQDIFAAADVPVSVAEARRSMGIAKRDHIHALLHLPRVAQAWEMKHGAAPREADLDMLYADFIPKQTDCLARYAVVIEGVPETSKELRRRGLRIGSTTGYTRPMLDFLMERARTQGFAPDCAVCPQDVPGGGRPAPWMCYLNAIRLEVSPLWAMVKIGDTPSDIAEGLNAGMWTVGITRTGNEVGLTEKEWNSANKVEQADCIVRARGRLLEAGAHYVVESVGESLRTIDEISDRIAAGDRP